MSLLGGKFSGGRLQIAKRGFDVNTATDAQMVLDSDWPELASIVTYGVTAPLALTQMQTVFFPYTLPFIPVARIRMAADSNSVPGTVRFYEHPFCRYNLGSNIARWSSLFDARIYRNRLEIVGTQHQKFYPFGAGAPTGFSNEGDHAVPRRFNYIVYSVPFIEGI